ncbi:hypothetical protein [Pontibacter sp. SGAir0037]|uniref:hypothetical protein n=1 Tax=Pontibacter sp. SGAir0037 TaxID=2571030 RepID=UPI0010CD68F7|nr:hypothetical protein [Pontibacter sp. SGAir0037]QCR23514.1 hypothetical protein C1N53_14965 [Pontibacter sp. SGAir0037]
MIKNTRSAFLIAGMALLGLSSCNTGTDPGETNTERSDIQHPQEHGANREYSAGTEDKDTTNLEKYYEGRDSTTFNDGPYNQDEQREKRGQ